MDTKDKHILLHDLCCRLPFGVKLKTQHGICTMTSIDTEIVAGDEQSFCKIGVDYDFDYFDIDEVKPVLRHLDSMTDSENREYQYVTERWMYDSNYSISDSIEWLNKRHFDYNGLIERRLAVKADINVYQRQNPTLITIDELNATLSNFINSACEWIRDNADVLRTCGSKSVFVEKFRKDIVSKL